EVGRLFAREPRHLGRQPRHVGVDLEKRERVRGCLFFAVRMVDEHFVEPLERQRQPLRRRHRLQLHFAGATFLKSPALMVTSFAGSTCFFSAVPIAGNSIALILSSTLWSNSIVRPMKSIFVISFTSFWSFARSCSRSLSRPERACFSSSGVKPEATA